MADIVGINVEGVQYSVRDAIAQQSISQLTETVAGKITTPSGGNDNDVLTKSGNSATWTTPTWNIVTSKPFNTIGDGLSVSAGALKADVTQGEADAIKDIAEAAQEKADDLWESNKGITFLEQSNTNTGYQKIVPVRANQVSVEKIGGKSVVWNQLLQNGNFTDATGWSVSENQGTVTVSNNEATVTVPNNITSRWFRLQTNVQPYMVIGHKYCILAKIKTTSVRTGDSSVGGNGITVIDSVNVTSANVYQEVGIIGEAAESIYDVQLSIYPFPSTITTSDSASIKKVRFFDLTKMFGAGNEPTTVAQFKAMFPNVYYAYNAGTMMSLATKSVKITGKNLMKFSTVLSPQTINGVTFVPNEDGSITLSGTCTADNTWYIYSTQGFVFLPGTYTFFISDTDKNVTSAFGGIRSGDFPNYTVFATTATNATFTVQDAYESFVFLTAQNGVTYNEVTVHPQLELGSTKTAFETHQETTINVPSAVQALSGYGDSVGSVCNSIEQDEDGRWWYHKRVGRLVLNVDDMNNSEEHPGWSDFGVREIAGAGKSDFNCLFELSSIYPAGINTTGSLDTLFIRNTGMTQTQFKTAYAGKTFNFYIVYETPVVTEITSYMADFVPKKCEQGGTITMIQHGVNTAGTEIIAEPNCNMGIPNTVKYIVATDGTANLSRVYDASLNGGLDTLTITKQDGTSLVFTGGGGGGGASTWSDVTGKPFATVGSSLQVSGGALDVASVPWGSVAQKPFATVGSNLKVENSTLQVDTIAVVQENSTKPVTSGAVYAQIGNLEALLASI